MRPFLICLTFIFIQLNASAQLLHGTYNYGKPKKGSYGLLQLHQTSPGNFLFYLEIGRDVPNFKSGALYDKLTFNKTSGHFEANTKGCSLQFVPGPSKITIVTKKGDCGFEYGVVADGVYVEKNHRNPSSLTTRTGKKLNFDNTTPMTFKED